MADLVVTPWKRYGHDRLYVNDGTDGQRVAFYDRKTGVLTVEVEEFRPRVLAALRPHMTDLLPPAPPETPSVPAKLLPQPASPPATDLASNRAGQAVSERAAELVPNRFVRWFAKIFRVRTAATSWEVGAKGERIVGAALASLEGRGWYVLQSVRLASGADIDHVVIGPAGVFTVNTKHHRRARIWVGDEMATINRTKEPYPRRSRGEASRAAKLLSTACGFQVQVQPVLAFVNAGQIRDGQKLKRILVADGQMLGPILWGLPSKLSPHMVDAIYAEARNARTWCG